jgi:hypothetical protein
LYGYSGCPSAIGTQQNSVKIDCFQRFCSGTLTPNLLIHFARDLLPVLKCLKGNLFDLLRQY